MGGAHSRSLAFPLASGRPQLPSSLLARRKLLARQSRRERALRLAGIGSLRAGRGAALAAEPRPGQRRAAVPAELLRRRRGGQRVPAALAELAAAALLAAGRAQPGALVAVVDVPGPVLALDLLVQLVDLRRGLHPGDLLVQLGGAGRAQAPLGRSSTPARTPTGRSGGTGGSTAASPRRPGPAPCRGSSRVRRRASTRRPSRAAGPARRRRRRPGRRRAGAAARRSR